MAARIKNTLTFNLAPGASVVLPHGLHTQDGLQLQPDIIFLPSPSLAAIADDVNVTLFNEGAAAVDGAILVEWWHTIEREFGAVQNKDLTVKPYIVVSAEGGNQLPQPPFVDQDVFVYVRTFGVDST